MTTALITTDPFFGPWNIPSRAQNMINNYYACKKNIKVDTIIPEPLFSNHLSTTKWVAENKDLSAIILCSIHQIPDYKEMNEDLFNTLADIEIHFSLEDIYGRGLKYLRQIAEEKRRFTASEIIAYESYTTYTELHNLMLST